MWKSSPLSVAELAGVCQERGPLVWAHVFMDPVKRKMPMSLTEMILWLFKTLQDQINSNSRTCKPFWPVSSLISSLEPSTSIPSLWASNVSEKPLIVIWSMKSFLNLVVMPWTIYLLFLQFLVPNMSLKRNETFKESRRNHQELPFVICKTCHFRWTFGTFEIILRSSWKGKFV